MAFAAVCDICQDEPAAFMVTATDTGQTNTMGNGCYGLIGLTIFLAGDPAYVDGVLKTKGYTPTAAEKRSRVEVAEPEFDAGRTVAEIVESAPRAPGDESASEVTDQPVSGLVDNDADAPVVGGGAGDVAEGPASGVVSDPPADDLAADQPPY